MKRLLVTGTRHGWKYELLDAGLYAAYRVLVPAGDEEQVLLVHGGAPGIDSQAAVLWQELGMPTEEHKADWKKFGRTAGPIRNSLMVDLGADLCVAFPDNESVGTWDCVRKARKAGITVLVMGEIKEPK